jgi:hypothetical protein
MKEKTRKRWGKTSAGDASRQAGPAGPSVRRPEGLRQRPWSRLRRVAPKLENGVSRKKRQERKKKAVSHGDTEARREAAGRGMRTFNIEHRTLNIEHRTLNIEHRTLNIEHRTEHPHATPPPSSFNVRCWMFDVQRSNLRWTSPATRETFTIHHSTHPCHPPDPWSILPHFPSSDHSAANHSAKILFFLRVSASPRFPPPFPRALGVLYVKPSSEHRNANIEPNTPMQRRRALPSTFDVGCSMFNVRISGGRPPQPGETSNVQLSTLNVQPKHPRQPRLPSDIVPPASSIPTKK